MKEKRRTPPTPKKVILKGIISSGFPKRLWAIKGARTTPIKEANNQTKALTLKPSLRKSFAFSGFSFWYFPTNLTSPVSVPKSPISETNVKTKIVTVKSPKEDGPKILAAMM